MRTELVRLGIWDLSPVHGNSNLICGEWAYKMHICDIFGRETHFIHSPRATTRSTGRHQLLQCLVKSSVPAPFPMYHCLFYSHWFVRGKKRLHPQHLSLASNWSTSFVSWPSTRTSWSTHWIPCTWTISGHRATKRLRLESATALQLWLGHVGTISHFRSLRTSWDSWGIWRKLLRSSWMKI